MTVRRFSSHYALFPDGTFRKWPVIEITGDGEIVSTSYSPEGFKEQPSLEFHGGILLPAFVDAWFDDGILSNDQRNLNQHLSAGTLVLGCKKQVVANNSDRIYPPFITEKPQTDNFADPSYIISNNNLPLFERLKIAFPGKGLSLEKMLYTATAVGADRLCVDKYFGRLTSGNFSGLIILEHIDLHTFSLNSQTRVRWLIQPKNPLL